MAPNEENTRRNREGQPENNPFIAFRRFADAQVSSLLNTVFTLPATIANFNNAHVAREHCLFGTANKSQCEKLAELEERIANLRSEGRELYRVGDLQKVLQKGEELMHLDRQADSLRRDIVEAARGTEAEERFKLSRQFSDLQTEVMKELGWTQENDSGGQVSKIQETSTTRMEDTWKSGHQWSWSWDWSYPKPADQIRDSSNDTDRRFACRRWQNHRDEIRKQQAQEQADGDADEGSHSEEGQRWARDSAARLNFTEPQTQTALNRIGDAITAEVPRILRSPSYSPAALENNRELNKAGVHWRDAFEDLIRAEHGAPLIPPDHLGAYQDTSYERWARRFQDPFYARSEYSQWVTAQKQSPPSRQTGHNYGKESEEPSYEYAHDHEDQHDEPPTPRAKQGKWSDGAADTELDAYERLLGRTSTLGVSDSESRQSILSTLTTTERTVGPDGTVTTKVVLKKRFADGREESSETVHTQRGHEDEVQQQDPWKDAQATRSKSQREQHNDSTKKKSWFWSN